MMFIQSQELGILAGHYSALPNTKLHPTLHQPSKPHLNSADTLYHGDQERKRPRSRDRGPTLEIGGARCSAYYFISLHLFRNSFLFSDPGWTISPDPIKHTGWGYSRPLHLTLLESMSLIQILQYYINYIKQSGPDPKIGALHGTLQNHNGGYHTRQRSNIEMGAEYQRHLISYSKFGQTKRPRSYDRGPAHHRGELNWITLEDTKLYLWNHRNWFSWLEIFHSSPILKWTLQSSALVQQT